MSAQGSSEQRGFELTSATEPNPYTPLRNHKLAVL